VFGRLSGRWEGVGAKGRRGLRGYRIRPGVRVSGVSLMDRWISRLEFLAFLGGVSWRERLVRGGGRVGATYG
jgi:hypothetical protein